MVTATRWNILIGMLACAAAFAVVLLVGWLIFEVAMTGDITQEIVETCFTNTPASMQARTIINDIGCP